MSTLTIPPVIPSAREDAKNLNIAFKGIGCDNSTIINILAHRNSGQIEFIQQEYENTFPDTLRKRVSYELRGHFKKAVSLWLREPIARDANVLKHALRAPVTNNKAVTNVICSRTPAQLRQLHQVYLSHCGAPLGDDIEYATRGDHKKLLLAYVNTTRYEGPEIDASLVANDARAIHKCHGDSKIFIRIFIERSRAHMAVLIPVYRSMFGKSLEEEIRKETSGNLGYALLAILRFVENPAKYFAKVLRKAMYRLGTDDSTLMWVVTTRSEIDMQHIKEEYKKKYGKTLIESVYSETSGHYRTFLLSLLGTNY